MKDGFIKVAAASPEVRVGDVEFNLGTCIKEAERYADFGARVIVFPELALTSASCQDMFYNNALLLAAQAALIQLAKRTARLDALIFVGLPIARGEKIYSCAAAVKGGKILAIIPSSVSDGRFASAPLGVENITLSKDSVPFGAGIAINVKGPYAFTVSCEVGRDSELLASPAAKTGASLIVTLAAEAEGIGVSERRRELVRSEAIRLCCAKVYANAAVGESGSECVYSAHSVIADHTGRVVVREPFSKNELTMTIDVQAAIVARRRSGISHTEDIKSAIEVDFSDEECELPLLSRFPFIPEDGVQRNEACRRAFEIQAQGLAGRFERSFSRSLVVGISGGLDSTLALLVMARAADILKEKGHPVTREIISAVTMPCFGTTERTKSNAERLAELLGARVKCIDIKEAVLSHFKDIGHDKENYNVVYENAQARERTQVLMDIANAEGGLVVGTGDLSEAALGWATYNGDHMSMYGVNASLPKTLIRAVVENYALECGDGEISAILRDILLTPVSPELLPPKEGEIVQCTEGIVGPYELHDFFIYHFVKEGASPGKLLRMANHAFSGVYSKDALRGWCEVFLKRFITQQFKRSCTPDAPSVGIISLSPRGAWQMPSDFSRSLFDIGGKK